MLFRSAALTARMTRRVITYGTAAQADVTATDIELGPMSVRATVHRRVVRDEDASESRETLGRLELRVPGHHNLLNALAAIAAGLELGVPFDRLVPGLQEFHGAERRFDVRGDINGVLVVDDYGHHPTEIAAVPIGRAHG